MNFVLTLRRGSVDYFDNVMTKFIVTNRTDARKTDVTVFFCDNKLSNCPLSPVDASYNLQIHVSVGLLTMKISPLARTVIVKRID